MFLTLSVKAKNHQCLNYGLQEYETRVLSKGLDFISQILNNQQSLVEVYIFFFSTHLFSTVVCFCLVLLTMMQKK